MRDKQLVANLILGLRNKAHSISIAYEANRINLVQLEKRYAKLATTIKNLGRLLEISALIDIHDRMMDRRVDNKYMALASVYGDLHILASEYVN